MESRTHVTSTIGQLTQQTFDPQTSPQTQPPADGRNGVFYRNFGKFERDGSTFHWKIFRPGREKLIGYSKPRDMAEKANKQELLMDCVKRLAKNGYLKDGLRIEFYRAFHGSDDDLSVKLFTLYATRFLPEPAVLSEVWLIAFLKNLYSPVVSYYNPNAGLFPTGGQPAPPDGMALIPDQAKQAPPKDPFDPERHFKSEDALMKHVEKLLLEGQPRGQVEEYYRQQIQRFHTRHS